MKDGQWYTISGWMGNSLGLRGNDLICFAVIYGFSMDGKSQFKGNLDYLTGCIFATQPTVLQSLKKLLECNLILKEEKLINGKKHCYYATNVIYGDGEFEVIDSTKKPLVMTTKESLVKTTKEPLVKNNNNKEQYNNKSVSNDTQKVEEETGLSFNDFYKLYPLKKSKQQAEKSWNRLSKADRQEAIDKLPAYIADCIQEKRSFKHPSTYLNQRTWEDDFTTHSKVSFYDALPTDSEQEKKFKNWMRTSYPNIENTALPLSYGDFMSLYEEYGTEEVKNQLEAINANIGKYKYSDINAIIRGNLEDI